MSYKRDFDEGVEKKGLKPKLLVDIYVEQKRQPLEVRSQGPARLTTFWSPIENADSTDPLTRRGGL